MTFRNSIYAAVVKEQVGGYVRTPEGKLIPSRLVVPITAKTPAPKPVRFEEIDINILKLKWNQK